MSVIHLEQRWAQRKASGGVCYSHFDAEDEAAGAVGGEASSHPQCYPGLGAGSKCPWALGLYSLFPASNGANN